MIILPVLAGILSMANLTALSSTEPAGKPAAATTGATTRPAAPPKIEDLKAAMEKVHPLHKKLGKPRKGDWLDRFPDEPGQTFAEYLACKPVTLQGDRNVIYVQPLGDFTKTQRKIVELAADFMGRYFNAPVKVQSDIPLERIPARARRTHPTWGDKQVLTTYVLDELLKPALPKDAAASIAFTSSDLWPGAGWNFVFGQASLRDRVGVWSIYRNGDPDKGEDDFRLCLLRTVKTATHETGHMFSMLHCIAYECNMCGSNHREEADRRPLALCPECMAKVCWATGADPVERSKRLADFCKAAGLKEQQEFYEKQLQALGGKTATATQPSRSVGTPADR
jgi:archaemetzincin